MNRPTAVMQAPPVPMLASAMSVKVEGDAFDRKYGDGRWVLEQKMDGHRVAVVVDSGRVQAFTGREVSEQHVRSLPPEMVDALLHLPDGIYDGELCADSGQSAHVTKTGARLVVVLFDVLQMGQWGPLLMTSYQSRRAWLLAALMKLPEGQQSVSTVESVHPTWATVQAIWNAGGEGAILKRVSSTYQPGRRSDDWIKVKRDEVAVGIILGFEAGAFGPHSVTVFKLPNGQVQTAKTRNAKVRADMAAHPEKYLGARLVVSHKGVLPSGKCRHPMFDHLAGAGE